ncbi:MAG TPA: hypothetical protein VFC65_05080 [Prolixibacteraceae bacterium]|nr:hypothetical protein [Prolixibacteraceae bacterium]
MNSKVNIIFLHHSTGKNIWKGETSRVFYKIFKRGDVQSWFSRFNKNKGTNYQIEEMYFPNNEGGYGWKNYPYDYYNIWIRHEGENDFMGEPTLETLTKKFNVIIWKHCFPVGDILPDTGQGDVDSEAKRVENYKLQYIRLKEKMRSFPNVSFIVWTGAALTRGSSNPEKAQRAKDFFTWVKEEWDEPGDNIYLWDFNELECEGGLYMKDEYASGQVDPHPNKTFAKQVAPMFSQRIVDVIEGRGDSSSIKGL